MTVRLFTAAAATLAASLLAGAASAQSLVALADGNKLITMDPKSGAVLATARVSGVPGLVGIDTRPADGKLYGLVSDGRIVILDPKTGAATDKSRIATMLQPGVWATVDFNPVADRLRVIGSDGTNLRVNVDDGSATTDGQLRYADADAMKGMAPQVVAGAYTMSLPGAKETALYDIDAAHGTLVKQAPPNDGVLNTVGKLGPTMAGPIAFEIVTTLAGDSAWLVNGGAMYQVNLATGAATPAGAAKDLPKTITDIAYVPVM